MKKRRTYFFLIFVLLPLISMGCSKNPVDERSAPTNYVKISIQGPTINGNFQAEQQERSGGIIASASYVPADPQTGGEPLVVLLLSDPAQPVTFTLSVPADKQRTQIIQDDPHKFEAGFILKAGGLEASEVSVNVTGFRMEQFGLMAVVNHMKGTFEGMFMHVFDENGQPIEEAHTISGEFEFNMP